MQITAMHSDRLFEELRAANLKSLLDPMDALRPFCKTGISNDNALAFTSREKTWQWFTALWSRSITCAAKASKLSRSAGNELMFMNALVI